MAKYIDEKTARQAAKSGTLVGRTEPMRETKGSWWQVYWDGSQLTGCVIEPSGGIFCGEQIETKELGMYCDEPEKAKELMAKWPNEKS